ncbi:MAG: hypothetical protein WBD36_02500 [Bacteroidota bacterium]
MNITITSVLITYFICGLIGFLVSRKIETKLGTFGWVLLTTLTIVSQWVLPGTRVIAIFAFEMYANQILQGFFAGMLLGLLFKKTRITRAG